MRDDIGHHMNDCGLEQEFKIPKTGDDSEAGLETQSSTTDILVEGGPIFTYTKFNPLFWPAVGQRPKVRESSFTGCMLMYIL